jgi:isochorismate hydrolase
MTSWKEGDDIKDYYSFEIAYCPKDADLNIYSCVSNEDDLLLIEQRDEAFKKEEEERMKSKQKDDIIEIVAE